MKLIKLSCSCKHLGCFEHENGGEQGMDVVRKQNEIEHVARARQGLPD